MKNVMGPTNTPGQIPGGSGQQIGVGISPNLKKISEWIDPATGNVIDPNTKQIIKRVDGSDA